MSNNPFKQPKNRFDFKEDKREHNNTFSQKKNKNTKPYYEKTNSNTKPYYEKTNTNTNTNTNTKEINLFSEENFPALVSSHLSNKPEKTSNAFKHALNQPLQIEKKDNAFKVGPGWIQITKTNGKIVYNDELCKRRGNIHLNDLMSKHITNMCIKWDLDRLQYDKLHGEGAYDDVYYLPNVYGPEYDDIDDSEDEQQPTLLDDDYEEIVYYNEQQ